MRIPELSHRLMSAVGFVRGGFFADVGTDHAHLPVYLYNTGKIDGAVASDINKGPLAIAAANIADNGAAAGVVTQLSDGLAELETYHPHDIAIFGMGGELIMRIIGDAPWVKDESIRLILQPMTKQAELRDFLMANGFEIIDEALSEDDGKLYQTLCAEYRPHASIAPYSRAERLVGRHNVERGGELFWRFLDHRIKILTVARDGKRLSGHPSEEDESNVDALCALRDTIRKKGDS